MDSNSKIKELTFEDRLKECVKDGEDVLYQIKQKITEDTEVIEIVVELPAAVDIDIIISHVQRWREIQKTFNRDLRVYAWSYSTDVEKRLLSCVQHMSRVCVTILPNYIRECKTYGQ